MSAAGMAASMAIAVLSISALVGLALRRRVQAVVLFPVYLVSAACGHLLVVLFPAAFWNWTFVAGTDLLQNALAAGIAFEIASKIFQPLRAGQHRIRFVMGLVTFAIILGVILYPRHVGSAFDVALVLERVAYGIAWLFGALLVVVRYYGVPIDPLHRDVACGFALLRMLMAFTESLSRYDVMLGIGSDAITKLLYPCLLAGWNISAWRKEDYGLLSAQAVRMLQPWRAS